MPTPRASRFYKRIKHEFESVFKIVTAISKLLNKIKQNFNEALTATILKLFKLLENPANFGYRRRDCIEQFK